MPESDRLGAALTGGVASPASVCLMSHLDRTEHSGRATIDTFFFDFGSEDADVVELIDLVASRVGARHDHIPALTPCVPRRAGHVIRLYDGPPLESVVLPRWGKKRTARAAGVDLLLSGLGGDELFMGTLHFLGPSSIAGSVSTSWTAAPPSGLLGGSRSLLRRFPPLPYSFRGCANAWDDGFVPALSS